MTTQLEGFRDFITEQLLNGGKELSPEQCLDLWRLSHPNEEQAADDLAAVYASIEDFQRGERGRPAGQTTHDLRVEFGIQPAE